MILSLIPIEFIGLYTDYHIQSLIGYIPFLIVLIITSYSIFKISLKNSLIILISRMIGVVISWISVHLFMNIYNSSGYFKPFSTDGFSIFLGIISFITILIMYLVIYSFSSKNQ